MMMNTIRLIRLPLGLLFGLLCGTSGAAAHPHVFAEARLDVMIAPDGKKVDALRHLWRFDDAFSATVVFEFDKNGNNMLDDAELATVRDTIFNSLADFNYFQLVTLDGKDVAMNAPDEFAAIYENNQLIVMFETKPKDTLELNGKVSLGVYDPTFYTAIDFVEDEQLAVSALPDGCVRTVVRPDADEIIEKNQQSLTEAFLNDQDGNDMSKIFATRLELTCPAHG